MTTAVVVSIIATLAFAFLRTRRRKLSPALRREYAEVAAWAERETTLITNAYARLRQDAARANRRERRGDTPPSLESSGSIVYDYGLRADKWEIPVG